MLVFVTVFRSLWKRDTINANFWDFKVYLDTSGVSLERQYEDRVQKMLAELREVGLLIILHLYVTLLMHLYHASSHASILGV